MTKDELKSIYQINKRIDLKRQQLKELEEEATSISIDYKEKVQTSKLNNSMCKVDSAIELQSLIRSELALLYEKRKQAYLMFTDLKGKQKALMEMRYLQGYSWEHIAYELDLSYRHVLRLHGEALANIFHN